MHFIPLKSATFRYAARSANHVAKYLVSLCYPYTMYPNMTEIRIPESIDLP